MDPLEKALVKARKQHGLRQLDEQDRRALFPAEAANGSGSPAVDPSPPNAAKSVFRLEQTRKHAVSPDTLAKHRLIAAETGNGIADRYRMLRAQVLRRLSASGKRSLGICGAGPNAGKSLTAANLAISTALDPNCTVLLVDFDLRRPTQQKYFDLNPGPGLVDYLNGGVELSECLVALDIGRLVLLPAGLPVRNSSEVLASPRVAELMHELGSRYPDRIVIYDLPPLLSGDDALVALQYIHATLLVVREGQTQAGEIQTCLSLLKDHNLFGTVLNCSRDENMYPYY